MSPCATPTAASPCRKPASTEAWNASKLEELVSPGYLAGTGPYDFIGALIIIFKTL